MSKVWINFYASRLGWLLLLLLAWLVPAQLAGAPLPAMDTPVSLVARETSANEFLEELFGLANIPVVVDSQVKGTVNGYFSDSAKKLHERTMKTLKLMTYYDGQVAHVYNAKDLKQEVLPVSSAVANKIVRYIDLLKLTDNRNTLSSGASGGLVVRGAPRFVEQVKEASISIRRSTKKYVPLVVEKLFYLKHAWVQDTTLQMGEQSMVVPGIVSILNELIAAEPLSTRSYPGFDSTVGEVSRMQSDGVGAQPVAVYPSNAVAQARAELQAQAGSSSNAKIEATRVVAVPRLNAVLVRDLESRMASYHSLIQALDVEPYMLEIEATIIDINSDRSKEFGVNWRYQRGDGNEALVGNGTYTDQLLNPGMQITPQGNGGILSLSLGNPASQFLARIRALETQGEAEIVSKPHVVTLSNVEAVLDTTQSFFVRVAASDDAALFKITAGTTLRVTPHVYRMDGTTRIKLMVHIQDGATSDAEVDQIPVIGNSNIRTQAIITDGDSLLVGGLVRESKRNGVSKVPFLGDIPGLGSIFRTNTASGSKVERLFLITPRLAFRNGFNEGKRMDAPVLQGSQSDIIGTSGNRIASTIKAIDRSDTAPDKAAPAELLQVEARPAKPADRPAVQAAAAAHSEGSNTDQPDQTPAPAKPTHVAPGQQLANVQIAAQSRSREQLLQSLLAIPAAPSLSDKLASTGTVAQAKTTRLQQASKTLGERKIIEKRTKWSVQAMELPVELPLTTAIQIEQANVSYSAGQSPGIQTTPLSENKPVVVASRRFKSATKDMMWRKVKHTEAIEQWQEIKPAK